MIKAQAQNVARNLADTPANRMTPTIFAQVSFIANLLSFWFMLQDYTSQLASLFAIQVKLSHKRSKFVICTWFLEGMG